MNKKIIIGIAAIVILALLFWWAIAYRNAHKYPPTEAVQTGQDYSQQLKTLNEVDVNSEFQDIDASASSL